ncbi:MAG: hypothetical protein F2754_08280 [Actinobacteria bacterium]|uniref:Unannotated protein n=1 Tax=freshwater metagenome TaxID=449393 RepID=A0A6J6SV66_9ZZZZ|nr:hypothetical protein [Actinomycetota bacterium]MSX87369.1 hypothetical protein [Actinomycetota bacterium]MSY71327.1 hypothetical protein [Actinomycetota bacterium]
MGLTDSARVRVDDALVGHLPPVCCMTGARADGFAPIIVPKRLGAAWLLLLAGPIGVAVLASIWPRVRVRYLVRLPMSAPAFERMHLLQVRRLWCSWLGGLGLVATLGLLWVPILAMAVFAVSVLSTIVAVRAHVLLPWTFPSAVAETGGRWIVLRGVHPGFVRAVATRRRPG